MARPAPEPGEQMIGLQFGRSGGRFFNQRTTAGCDLSTSQLLSFLGFGSELTSAAFVADFRFVFHKLSDPLSDRDQLQVGEYLAVFERIYQEVKELWNSHARICRSLPD